MTKKDIFIDTLSAAGSQAVTIATVTNPTTAIIAVATIAMMSGFSKLFLSSRRVDIEQMATELSGTETARKIKEMGEQEFLDDLTFSIEKILNQRTSPKRVLMRNVFLGYIKTEHKISYPLERMYNVVENLTFADIDYFRRIFMASGVRDKHPIPWVSKEVMNRHKIPEVEQEKMTILTHSEDGQDQQSKANLITEGLLIERNMGIGGWSAGEGTPQIYITQFGQYFKKYLLEVRDL